LVEILPLLWQGIFLNFQPSKTTPTYFFKYLKIGRDISLTAGNFCWKFQVHIAFPFWVRIFLKFQPPKNTPNNFSIFLKNNRVLHFPITDFLWKFQVNRIFLSWDIVFTTFVTDYIHTYIHTDRQTDGFFQKYIKFVSEYDFIKNFVLGPFLKILKMAEQMQYTLRLRLRLRRV